jgi:hypothetical protein
MTPSKESTKATANVQENVATQTQIQKAGPTTKPLLKNVKASQMTPRKVHPPILMEQLFTSDGRALIFHNMFSPQGTAATTAAVVSILAGTDNYFVFEDRLARVIRRKSKPHYYLVEWLSRGQLAEALSEIVCTVTIDPMATEIDEIDIYSRLARRILTQKPFHEFRPLLAVLEWPARRPDGSWIVNPGYDRRSGCFVSPTEGHDSTGDPELDALIESLS